MPLSKSLCKKYGQYGKPLSGNGRYVPEGLFKVWLMIERILGAVHLHSKFSGCHIPALERCMLTASVLATVNAFLDHLYRSISTPSLLSPNGSIYSASFVSIVRVIQSSDSLGANALCMPLEPSAMKPQGPFSPLRLSLMIAIASSPASKILGDTKLTKGLKVKTLEFFWTADIRSGELTT